MGLMNGVIKKIRVSTIEKTIVFLLLFLLPTQLGKHFFLRESYVNGVAIDYLSFTPYVTDILVLALIIMYWRSWSALYKKHIPLVLLGGFLAVVNILQSPAPILAIYTLWKFFEVYVLFFIFRFRKTSISDFLTPLTFGSLLQGYLVLQQYLFGHSIQGAFYFLGERAMTITSPGIAKVVFFGEEILRPYGTFSHPNSMGGFYLLLWALCLYIRRKAETQQEKILLYVTLFFSTLMVFFSFSKGAILTYVVLTSLYFFKYSKKRSFVTTVMKVAIPIALCFIFLVGGMGQESISQRWFLMKQAFVIMKDTLFLGTGFGQHFYYQSKLSSPYPYFFMQPVHNVFLLFLLQAGVIYSSVALFVLLNWIRKYYLFVPLLFLTILMTGMFDHYWITLQQNLLALGVFFGAGVHFTKVVEVKQ